MRRNDNRGTMPFAIVAVTILMLSVAAAAVTASYQRANDGVEGTEDDVDAVGDAVDDITTYVNMGLGSIILAVSTDDTLGGLEERAEVFSERADAWIAFQFPMVSGGVTAECLEYDISLVAEPMGLDSEDALGGYTPTYLRGTGTITVHLASQHGKAQTDLEVYSDGSYALPLAEVRGSLFESMSGGSGISLSQMMSSQLTALAEYRIMNGYGGTSAYGEMGTDSIITAEDVEDAYAVCMQAISAICFRDSDNSLSSKASADLADLLVSDGGKVTIDLSAVYAQALMSAVDDIALKWIDYLYGFEVLEALYGKANPLAGALGSLASFLSGEERVDGAPYLQSAMSSNGYSEDEWRNPGSGTTEVSVGGLTVSVTNPTADLLSQSWLSDFKKRYDAETSYVEDYVVGVLKAAAVLVAERSDLGYVSATVDPYDSESLAETLSALFEDAVEGCADAVEDTVSLSLSDAKAYDEFYGSLADEVLDHADDMVLESEFLSAVRSSLEAAAEADGIEIDVDALMASDEVAEALESYRSAVYSDLAKVESLRTMDSGSTGIVESALAWVCSYGLEALDILSPMEDRARQMTSEMLGIEGTNPYGGVVDLPGETSFQVTDENGNVMSESLSASFTLEETSVSVGIVESGCVHTVGFREDSSAAYSTVFSVSLQGWVSYSVTGAGSFASAMGTTSSAYSGGFAVDFSTEVTVASGWALAGIEYSASDTVLTDLWKVLLEVLEPIIEPLRVVLEAIRSAATVITEALMEAAGFASDMLLRLYEMLMEPTERLKEILGEYLEDLMCDTVLGVLVDIDMGDQTIAFEYFGCTLTLTTSAVSWAKTTKTLFSAELSMPVSDLTVTAGIKVKLRGDVAAENLIITGSGGVAADDWDVEATVDPLMKGSKYLFSVDGSVGDTDFSLVAPKLENYYEMGVALSDVPGIGEALDNIPVPGLGVNIGLDAGFSLRYTTAIETGLLINEFESNPAGTDTGKEWIELVNNGDTTIDLEGYELVAASDRKSKRMTLSGTLAPGEYLVVYPDFILVNSSGKNTRSGEGVKLYDPDGNLVDETPIKADTSDNGDTWQRKFDGSTEWVLDTGTQGKSNAGSALGAVIAPSEMKDCVWDAVEKAFGKVGSIQDVDTLVTFIQYLVRYTIEEVIGVVTAQIVDASVYVSVDVSDATSTASSGIRVALRTDGDMVEDCLKYVAGQVESLLLGMKNPYRIDPLEAFTENVDLEVSAHARIGFPEILSKSDDMPEVDIAAVFRANLASLTKVLGVDTGDAGIEFGLLIRDCPEVLIPSKLSAKDGMEHDLWLFKATVTFG
ncbi:MAG: lamin tail domain-containing protein [Thermoplasmata archaeon]|nr:lamin tail domain-containing protein [Thermoplasmata archaeon]